MADYSIIFARTARKELEALDAAIVSRILPKMESLSSNPRPHHCVKLRGAGNLWRLRIGVYRVIYAVDDEKKLIDIVAVRHRRDAYR